MAGGWANLGDALAGDDGLSYEKGRAMGAQTENALTQAAERVAKEKARQGLSAQLVAAGLPQSTADASAGALAAGAGLGDVITMIGKKQEQDFRTKAADPNTSFDLGNRALMGVASGPVDPVQKVGNGYIDRFNTAKGVTALPAGARDASTQSGQMQLLDRFGFPDTLEGDAQKASALNVLRDLTKMTTAGEVPYIINTNPYGPGGAPAGPVSPGLGDQFPGGGVPPAAAGPPALGDNFPGPAAAPVAPAATPPIAGPRAVVPVETAASNAATMAGAKEKGKMQAEALQQLPATLATLDKMNQSIDKLLTSPGFNSVYGNLQGPLAKTGIPGLVSQDTANSQAYLNNLFAQTFGVSIKTLKGYGQLSNAEGMKVQDAYTAATQQGLSEVEARNAWTEVKTAADRYKLVAKYEAGLPGATAQDIVRQSEAQSQPATFATEAEAAAAGLKPGTRVTIGGVPGTWQ